MDSPDNISCAEKSDSTSYWWNPTSRHRNMNQPNSHVIAPVTLNLKIRMRKTPGKGEEPRTPERSKGKGLRFFFFLKSKMNFWEREGASNWEWEEAAKGFTKGQRESPFPRFYRLLRGLRVHPAHPHHDLPLPPLSLSHIKLSIDFLSWTRYSFIIIIIIVLISRLICINMQAH